MSKKILIVEDELIAAEYLKEVLLSEGFEILQIVDTGKMAIKKALEYKPDLILMDIMLKDSISGSDAALEIYEKNPDIAIIFLSAYSNSDMLDCAIKSNSYGYLMKPYNEVEIINTMKIVLAKIDKETKNKQECVKSSKIYFSDEIYFDNDKKRLFNKKGEVALGSVAIKLLSVLCKTPNTSISLDQIYNEVWNEPKSATTLRTLVYRIRQQSGADFIKNVNGLGYMVSSVNK